LDLLHVAKQIEKEMGRLPKTAGDTAYHDRIIDIDLLLYGDLHLQTPELTLPHPLMRERDFVMRPLAEIYLLPVR
jgi:2-amino-4-hydroxy-6-hydroxymethyldihydropteridine diphosphokinase